MLTGMCWIDDAHVALDEQVDLLFDRKRRLAVMLGNWVHIALSLSIKDGRRIEFAAQRCDCRACPKKKPPWCAS
jgi:hypothetical protein